MSGKNGKTVKEILAELSKDFGDTLVSKQVEESPRLFTGMFPFDLATFGFPLGKISIVWGKESSGKTLLAYKAIAQHQKLYKKDTSILFDYAHSHTNKWAQSLGVDTSRLLVMEPENAEYAVDQLEELIKGADTGVIVLDDIASMVTIYELEASASQELMGKTAQTINKMARKVNNSLYEAARLGNYPAFIGINQIRHNVGVRYGSPDVMPGGNAFKFFSSFTVKMYSKTEVDTKISSTHPAWLNVTGQVTKWKVPITATKFELQVALVDSKNSKAGDCLFWNTMKKFMQEMGYMKKDKKGWIFDGKTYKVQNDILSALENEPEVKNQLQMQLCHDMISRIGQPQGKLEE